VAATLRTGQVGMEEDTAEALSAFRACNYERIYLRQASVRQGEAVIQVLRALVEHFADRPQLMADTSGHASLDVLAGSQEALVAAVTYVAGMTDRFAFRQAVALLGWDPEKLPAGVGS
jgi:dGTPase